MSSSNVLTRINNNQISDAVGGNTQYGITASTKIQPNSITSALLANNLVYGSDFTIAGNLSVTGNVVAIDSTNILVEDPLLALATNNTSGILDIGLVGVRPGSNVALVWKESSSAFVTAFTLSLIHI